MRQAGLSKSKYMKGLQCPKMLWMDRNMPDQYDDSVVNEAILATGNTVGDLAMGYYGDYVEIPFDHKNLLGMARRTEELLREKCPVICEATFAFEDNLCLVDILRIEDDGVRIVEVKSSTKLKDEYLYDMAYQTWVVRSCGLNVKSVSLMHVNNRYTRRGKLNLRRLFKVHDCTNEVMAMVDEVPLNTHAMRRVMLQESEPHIQVGQQCRGPYECGYRGWCWRNIPSPSIFDLSGFSFDKALELMDEGIVTIPDALEAGAITGKRQLLQARCEAEGIDEVIDREGIAKFLDQLHYPLCFLDFETWMPAIPPFDGTHPYQQLPTQYSLHVLRTPTSGLEHFEFLATPGTDPRRAVAEHLTADIPAGACILAYNMSFEKMVMRELARDCPDLAGPLLDARDNVYDLIVPFRNTSYYRRAMGGRYSLKVVLPALFPDDPDLDYHALEGVHNGGEAAAAYDALALMGPEERKRAMEQLLRYCELDTYAMVRIWQRLMEVTGKKVDAAPPCAAHIGAEPANTPEGTPTAGDSRDEGGTPPKQGGMRSLLQRIFNFG